MTSRCQGYYDVNKLLEGDDSMKESRLFRILYYLLDKGKATAPQLAERFEVSVRTIYRDVDVLSSTGIPIYITTGRNGGIQLLDNYVLDKSLFSSKEKQEMLSMIQSLSAIQYPEVEGILEKLGAIFQTGVIDWIEVDFSRWGEKPYDNNKFQILKTAIVHHRYVVIEYASSMEDISIRTIQPLKLLYKSKGWYLKAYCTNKQDDRTFKLNRILKVEILEERFTPTSMDEQKEEQPKKYNSIVLQFPKEMAYRVYDEFSSNQIVKKESGDFIVTAQMPEDSWLIGFLLSFGAQVEVISPTYLRTVLAEKANEIYNKNKS